MSVITEQVLDIIPCSCLRDSKFNGNQVAGGMWQFPFPMCKPPARSQWKKKKPPAKSQWKKKKLTGFFFFH